MQALLLLERLMMNHRTMRSVALLTAGFTLVACTSVGVQYFESTSESAARRDLDSALAYLKEFRSHYQAEVQSQMARERNLANTLIGGGALMAALALGSAHRDAITGTGLLAGAGYTVGNYNLPRSQVLVRLAGIDALTCAEKAVAPLTMVDTSATTVRT
jgi:hypothetical protein